MDFQRIRVEAFGTLRDLDTGPEPLPRIVAVLGPNEAGKSTLFTFLTSMLYGIYPAARDRNPYTPWGGGDIDGRAVLRMDDGGIQEIHRRLLSSPSGALTRGNVTEDVRNHTLPCAEHVPREVFRQVFALTLAELATLAGESWERVQDRLVTGMGASDLASVRSVADDLEREAGRLWRPTRMGHQKVRDLRERIRDLRLKRRAAADADRKLREAARERDSVAARLREARRERERCHLYVERCQTLLPLRDRLQRIDELLEEAGPLEELEGLPADPEDRLSRLDDEVSRLEERSDALDTEAAEPGRTRAAFGDGHRTVLARAGDIRDALGRAAALEPLRVRSGQLEQEVRDLRRRAEDAAAELLDVSWADVDGDALLAVPTSRLRRAVERYREAREDRRLADEAVRGRSETPGFRAPFPPLLGPALVAGGLALVVAGAATGRTGIVVAAALLAGVGGALMAVDRRLRTLTRGGDDPGPARERLDRARAAEDAALDEVRELLADVPVRDDLLGRPPAELGAELQRFQDLLRDLRDRTAQLAEIRGRLDGYARDLAELARDLEVEPGRDPGVTAHRLETRLEQARGARDAADVAERELARIARERSELGAELEEARTRRDRLRERLASLARPDEDGLWAVEAVHRRLEARDRARRLVEELERDHPDLEELRRRIRRVEESGAGWSLDADTLAARKARESELAERVEELGRRLEGLQKDMEYLGQEETVGAVEGELEAVRAELEAAVRDRDRLWVIASLLREADRRFREEHQPDILRRTGCHLSTITGGRYDKLLLDEAGEGRFHLQGPEYPGPVEVGEPISRGTREQVYLALRMAILDHLDRGGERLPLFMDEAFVNWDRERRERGFGLLDEIARTRQVFVFTCHDDMAGSLAARGARVLVLDGGP